VSEGLQALEFVYEDAKDHAPQPLPIANCQLKGCRLDRNTGGTSSGRQPQSSIVNL
jgi:hypothetical protein